MNKDEAKAIFKKVMGYVLFTPVMVRGVWLAKYADMGLKGRRATRPFTMWAAIRGKEARAGFEIRKEALEWAEGSASGFSAEAVERVRKALKDDASGNAKCTMTDLDLACDMLGELAALRRKA